MKAYLLILFMTLTAPVLTSAGCPADPSGINGKHNSLNTEDHDGLIKSLNRTANCDDPERVRAVQQFFYDQATYFNQVCGKANAPVPQVTAEDVRLGKPIQVPQLSPACGISLQYNVAASNLATNIASAERLARKQKAPTKSNGDTSS